MIEIENKIIAEEFFSFLNNRKFPCVAAKAAAVNQRIFTLVISEMDSSVHDEQILQFVYSFIDDFRKSEELFHSAAIIFKDPVIINEEHFEQLMWKKLQSLSNLDAKNYHYDKRVEADPNSPDFSFSLKEEAFFVLGLHPASSRLSRKFKYPTLVFNPHIQFEKLREEGQYEKMKSIVRKRDNEFSGSINPMLDDFGHSSEVKQYSGKQYAQNWRCPLKINHKK